MWNMTQAINRAFELVYCIDGAKHTISNCIHIAFTLLHRIKCHPYSVVDISVVLCFLFSFFFSFSIIVADIILCHHFTFGNRIKKSQASVTNVKNLWLKMIRVLNIYLVNRRLFASSLNKMKWMEWNWNDWEWFSYRVHFVSKHCCKWMCVC